MAVPGTKLYKVSLDIKLDAEKRFYRFQLENALEYSLRKAVEEIVGDLGTVSVDFSMKIDKPKGRGSGPDFNPDKGVNKLIIEELKKGPAESGRALARRVGASAIGVFKSIERLESHGIIRRVPGKGRSLEVHYIPVEERLG